MGKEIKRKIKYIISSSISDDMESARTSKAPARRRNTARR
jgi:hypothetical protein